MAFVVWKHKSHKAKQIIPGPGRIEISGQEPLATRKQIIVKWHRRILLERRYVKAPGEVNSPGSHEIDANKFQTIDWRF